MKRTAIIAYDLQRVQIGDNARIKQKLESYNNVNGTFQVWNDRSLFPQWVMVNLPNTTLLVEVSNPLVTAKKIAEEVYQIILEENAIPDKVYVAFIGDGYLLNT